jgi:hypothetical protein
VTFPLADRSSSDASEGNSVDYSDSDSSIVSVGMDHPTNPTCLHAVRDISLHASLATPPSSTAASSPQSSHYDAGLDVPSTITAHLCDLSDSDIDSSISDPCESDSFIPLDDEDCAKSDHELSDSGSPPSPDAIFPRTLTRQETQESLDTWKQDMLSWLATDSNFEPFLSGCTWTKATRIQPSRGLSDDLPSGRSAHEQLLALNAMLARFSRFCPVLSPRAICERATSMDMIWQLIFTHFGYKC